MYELIPALTCLEDGLSHSTVHVQVHQLATVFGGPSVKCCYHVQSLKVADGVGFIDDGGQELIV